MNEPQIGIDASRGFQAGERTTGTERYAREVVVRLAAMGGARWRLYARPGAAGLPAGAEARRLGPARVWTHLGLGREVALRPPDLLYVPAHVLPLPCRPRAVATVHDVGFRLHPEAHPPGRRLYLEWSTRRHVRIAARLVVDSRSTARDLERLYGADPARIAVAPLGVDAPAVPPDAADVAALRARLGLPPGARYVLHVGTLQPRKNLARLVGAMARLAPDRPELHLVLAGGPGWGGTRADLAARALRAGIGGRVHLAGYVAEADLPALYGGAAVVAVPSLHEGFGLPALEAMAHGVPVALASGSSLPEVGGDAARYFPPEDEGAMAAALAGLLDDAGLAAALAAAGRVRAASFTWDATAARVREALDAALGEGGRRRAAGAGRPGGAP